MSKRSIACALRVLRTGALVVLPTTTVFASGYHFGTQSVSSQGVANSNPAEGADATVIFYNPAGLTLLDGDRVSLALVTVDPHIEADNVTSVNAQGATIYGPGSDGPASTVLVPQLYWAHQFNDRLFGGIGLFVPFGDRTHYQRDWVGRYNGIELNMKTITFNPQLAYKVNDHFSVGFGVSAQYMEARFLKAADFGTLAATNLPAFAQGLAAQHVVLTQTQLQQAALASMSNPQYDGVLTYEGDDWGFGFNVGLLWQVDETLRFGLAYRSSIEHKLEGDAEWSRPSSFENPVFANVPMVGPVVNAAWNTAIQEGLDEQGFEDGNGLVEVDTPDSLALNVYKQLGQFAITADWTHTWHDKFDELRLDFETALPDAVIDQGWHATDRYSAGVTYSFEGSPLKLRGGIAFDESPVPDDERRISNLPDNDRTWYSVGASYAFANGLTVDAAYTYVDIKDASMNNTECVLPACTGSGTTTRADFTSYANIFGVQFGYKFR
jgi:long-chain fatty acid transport protein